MPEALTRVAWPKEARPSHAGQMLLLGSQVPTRQGDKFLGINSEHLATHFEVPAEFRLPADRAYAAMGC